MAEMLIDRTTDQLKSLSLSVLALSKSFRDPEVAEMVCRAYDAGLATGFFGKQSAIAEGARQRLSEALRGARDLQWGHEILRLIRQTGRYGQQHGAYCRLPVEVEQKNGQWSVSSARREMDRRCQVGV